MASLNFASSAWLNHTGFIKASFHQVMHKPSTNNLRHMNLSEQNSSFFMTVKKWKRRFKKVLENNRLGVWEIRRI